VLVLPRTELERIHRHASESSPEECCGFLIGEDGEERRVLEARPARNVHPGPRASRYTLDPLEVLRLDRELRGGERHHLGFYHSHLGYPAIPSTFDLERAWPGYTYLIVGLDGGEPGKARAWRLAPATKGFEEEPVSVR